MAEPGSAQEGADHQAALTVEAVIRQRLSDVLGGWYGSLETALPTVAFVVTWLVTDAVRPALLAAGGVALALVVVRMAIGGPLRYVLTSLVGVGVAAFFALRSGEAQDAFLPGILTSAAYGVAALLSILGRWPLVGFLVAAGDPAVADEPTRWRRDPAMVRVCSRLTWVLVGLFGLRVAIMLPLWFAGEVAWLGVSKIVLGWPAYLLAVVLMGVLLAVGRTPQTAPAASPGAR